MKSGRVMILGLDGATLTLIRPWAEAGILPTFQKLMRDGAWGPLRSTMPPLTPIAWSSFLTGMNPGKHGVFDFTTQRQGTYDRYLVKSSLRQAPSLWQLASRAGKRVIVYNVPLTYPPERVNGLMVSGLLTPPGAKDASYPPELQKELEEAVGGPIIASHGMFRRGHEAEFVRELLQNHENTFRAARHMLKSQPWDLFVTVFQHTDTMGHIMWKYAEDKGADMPESVREVVANAMQDCYRDVDAKLGQLIQEAGDGTRVIVMSDHGHGRMEWSFRVNTWLLQKGYIQLKQDAFTQFRYLLYRLGLTQSNVYGLLLRLGLGDKMFRTDDERVVTTKQRVKRIFLSFEDIDWSRTQAYSYGSFGPIFVNLKGREPNGIVEPGKEYDEVLDQLGADLAAVKQPGTNASLFPEIHRGRDIYWGPFAERGPDLVFFPRDWRYVAMGVLGFQSKDSLARVVIKTGTHRMDGILFLSGPGIREGYEISGSSIIDVAPTALALLGVPVPQDMDGRVLEAAMCPELKAQLNVTFTGADGSKPELVPVEEMSPEDEDILITRLRNLGYLG